MATGVLEKRRVEGGGWSSGQESEYLKGAWPREKTRAWTREVLWAGK